MTTNLPNKELLRPDEIATYLSLSVKTIYCWIAEGKLEANKICGTLRVKREDVEKIITPAVQ